MRLKTTLLLLTVLAGRLHGQVVISRDTTISSAIHEGMHIVDGSTVELIVGGDVREVTEVFDSSTLSVTAGQARSIHAYDSSVVNYSSSRPTNITTYNFSTAPITLSITSIMERSTICWLTIQAWLT